MQMVKKYSHKHISSCKTKAHLTHSKITSFPMVDLYLNPETVNMHFRLSVTDRGKGNDTPFLYKLLKG